MKTFTYSTVVILKTRKFIDWVSVTLPTRMNWKEFLPFVDLRHIGKGRHGYGQTWEDKRTGARIETMSDRDDMGHHVTLTGDVLEAMRNDLGMIDDKLAERIVQWNGKCSRIDVTIDCFGAQFTPNDLNAALLNKSARLNARTWRFIEGHRGQLNGATIDTGSPTSDKRFRFYDKRAEKRIKDGEAWVRLELQLRRIYARSTVGACVEHGVSCVTSTLIGDYLTWSNTDYRAAIADSGDVTMSIPRSESKRRSWLLGQVAKALASEVHIDPDFRERFDLMVNYWVEQLDNQVDNQGT